jgi:ubiquinone/menaquinone biosynthesis C-methylase UbiE
VISKTLFKRFYPDQSKDGGVAFYGWIRKHIDPNSVVLNLGAGPPADRGPLRSLKGEVSKVIGADIDPEVLSNPEVDEAYVIKNGRLPFSDSSFSLVYCDWVLEHIEHPLEFLAEVNRVLRPQGSFFFRTPNKGHYMTLISRVTPHWFHALVANWARGYPGGEHEPWPTKYRLNSRKDILQAARRIGFAEVELRMWEYQPLYLVFHAIPFVVGVGYERLVNRYDWLAGARASILGRLIK